MLRLLRHLFTPSWVLKLKYPQPVLEKIAARIGHVEMHHPGELRFVAEHALDLGDLIARVTPRERAIEVFAQLRVWDTERNNGVLIYVLHAEHAMEIVVDRALARVVPQADWDALCRNAETEFRAGRHAEGALVAVDGAARLLEKHFPGAPGDGNELPDQPLLL
ncbi:MAG TPA: TPM domain-containing protein [Steroidobacteraceae bacterium]|nr:TPM domain-containing protein [Steroidobacteraceae bacterium]